MGAHLPAFLGGAAIGPRDESGQRPSLPINQHMAAHLGAEAEGGDSRSEIRVTCDIFQALQRGLPKDLGVLLHPPLFVLHRVALAT